MYKIYVLLFCLISLSSFSQDEVSADWSVSIQGTTATLSIDNFNNFTVGLDGHWHYILNNEEVPEDLSSLRFARSASAPLSPDIHKKFEKRFGIPIIETMGLTETGSQITTNPMPPGQRKIGSPGKAYGNQIMIGDDQYKA